MKKLLILAVCAVCATAAQAINISWTHSGDAVYDKTYIRESSSGNAFSLAMTVKLLAVPDARTEIANIGQWASGKSNIYANPTEGSIRLAKTGNGGTKSTNVTGLSLGTPISLVLTFAFADNGNLTISYYANGQHLYDVATGNTAINLNVTVNRDDTLWSVDDTTAYEGILSAEQIAYLNTKGTSVLPEPTVLALLALGVAGLALRRNVAA